MRNILYYNLAQVKDNRLIRKSGGWKTLCAEERAAKEARNRVILRIRFAVIEFASEYINSKFYISTSSIAYRSNQLNYLQLENADRYWGENFSISPQNTNTHPSASKSQLQILDKFNNETSNAYSLLHARHTAWIFPFINVERRGMKIILFSLSLSFPFFPQKRKRPNSLIIFTRGWIPGVELLFSFFLFFFPPRWIDEIMREKVGRESGGVYRVKRKFHYVVKREMG